jgi:NAD(P)-dependent dehydrogenase (short-subunit alcohol dehydrogenase family)
MSLTGKVVLVTGGAGGLGEATVRQLKEAGASVVIADIADEKGEALAGELGDSVAYVHTDVLDDGSVAAALDRAGQLGEFRYAVIAHGGFGVAEKVINRDGEPASMDGFKKTIDLYLTGTYNVLRLAAARIAKLSPYTDDGERGAVVMTASIAGYEGQMGQSAYASAKGGVIGLTLVGARDLAAVGIRVNTIAPGTIRTPLMELFGEEGLQKFAAAIPFPKRLGKPSEYALLAQHLLENTYVNGEVVRMDGAQRFQPKQGAGAARGMANEGLTRQTQPTLRDDSALDLAGSRVDRCPQREPHDLLELPVLRRRRIERASQRIRADHFVEILARAFEGLGAEELRHRTFRGRFLTGLLQPRAAIQQQGGDLDLDRRTCESPPHVWIVDPCGATRVRGFGRPLLGVLQQPGDVRAPSRGMFVLQREQQDLPPRIHLADAPLVADAKVAVERDVGALSGECPHRLRVEALGIGRNEEHRQALVLRYRRVGARQQEYIVGDVPVSREHLGTVDHPVVAFPHRASGGCGDIGPAFRLAKAQCDRHVAVRGPGQHPFPNERCTNLPDDRRDHACRLP